MNGPVPAASVLRLHLNRLAAVKSHMHAILLLMPQDASKREVPGYGNVTDFSHIRGARKKLPCPLEMINVPNNTPSPDIFYNLMKKQAGPAVHLPPQPGPS